MFFRYSSFDEFNFAFVGHVQEYGTLDGGVAVTLMDGRKCAINRRDRDAFYEAFERFKERCQLVALPPLNTNSQET